MTRNREGTIDAIGDAFDREGLETVLINKLDIKLDDLVTITKKFPDQLSELVQSLIQQGRLVEALNAFSQARPQNEHFQREMKLAIAALQQATAEGKSPAEAEDNPGSRAKRAFSVISAFLGTQKNFFAGAVLMSLLISGLFFLIPSDEVAIKTLNEAGDPIDFVSLFYYPKTTSSNAAHDPDRKPLELKLVERKGDDYRVFLNDISEPISIRLEVNEAAAPPQFVGNNRPASSIQVQKVSFDNSRFWFWNPRRLYLFVKISSGAGGSR